MRVPLDRVLGPIGVRRIAATVTGIDTGSHTVTAIQRDATSRTLAYDRLVLASGSQVVRPALPVAEHLFDIDTMARASALDAHLHRLPEQPGRFTAVVVGAGFIGPETATELVGRLGEVSPAGQIRVVLVERRGEVDPELGPGPRPEIKKAQPALSQQIRQLETELGVEHRGRTRGPAL